MTKVNDTTCDIYVALHVTIITSNALYIYIYIYKLLSNNPTN